MWLFVSSYVYEMPRLLSLLVLVCIGSKDERDIPSSGVWVVEGSLLMAA